ncbi:SPOR domain-containing protein [Teredinibacter turnerae]|uniref:SPOR domain-containing protein n=1 Tax=Teredinibacter turnerae TaxID=2426 RepID=UPI0003796DF4|nr:SPOR domain-containing protein [Teredinibacter turnerae]
MDDGLKQRIIGAFVLVAIAVVLVPLVFDRERIEPVNKQTQIPMMPSIEPVVIAEPAPPVIEPDEEAPEPAAMYVPDDKKDIASAEPEPVLDARNVPNSWVIQVASYRIDGHAEQMQQKLVDDGYSAYVRKVKTERGTLQRLYIGPNLDKAKLNEIKAEVEKKYGLSTILLKFKP